MPFWLRANQWGTVPLTTPAGTLRAGFRRSYTPTDTTKTSRPRRFDWTVGAQVVGNAATESRVLLPELYAKGRWRSIELAVGRWRQLTGLGDSTLSSGFINGSGNAIPIPKVQLATRGYVPLGFTKRFVAINAGFVHGWFTGAYIHGAYLHQKYVYLRLGKPASRFKGYLGINHEVQWAGQADYLIGSTAAVNGKLPSQFNYYPAVVLGTRPDSWETADYTSFDGAYWFGNGLGSMDLGVEMKTATGTWLLYHQHIYEDLSGLLWINAPDGLTGLSWHRNAGSRPGWLNRIVVEYLTTTNQSGSTFDYNAKYQGADNYFDHGQYIQGWSYMGRTIGTPFIMPQNEVVPTARTSQFFPNNRVQMGYVGAAGQLGSGVDWTVRLSYSRNYGTFSEPYLPSLDQFSALVSAQWHLPRMAGTQLTASLAADQGQLLPSTIGGFVSLRKQW
ncbi:capsule assembly Wzi family protein [Spirosoma rhododendri]|uniref:Capsule assembly Wzi family protein n=1 Tax=Spirosoma rhododendri TaxID=2728024 RepID=A0A7L5DH27_9BACT|nr:capsule assembly Wzi family protein [Spirosoma rhododendri]QJD77305.1 capsule assembly Wzi family protein [Spirosoma rhododendri]